MNRPDVVVIGAGIVGTTLAAALVARGRTVTLVEAAQPGAGTSSTSYAWINSHKKDPLDYHELNLRGMAAWRVLAEKYPEVTSFAGHIEIATGQTHRRNLTARTERLIGLGYEARWASPAEARSRTSVTVAEDALVAIFDGEGIAFPLRLIRRLTAGLAVREGAVAGIEGSTVVLADGERVEAGAVVICAGTRSDALVASAGGRLPLVEPRVDSPSYGYLADVIAPGHGLTSLVTTDTANLRPGENGLLLVQTLDLDATAEPGVAAPISVVEEIGRRVAVALPHTTVQVQEVRVGHRVIPADGFTAAGPIAPGSPVWAVVTHSGVTLSPWLAEVIADELCGAEPEPLLENFRPSRFLESEARTAPDASRAPGDQ